LTIPLTVPSPIATLTATIPVDEDRFIEIDRDVRELYTRSGAVRDEIFSQRGLSRPLSARTAGDEGLYDCVRAGEGS
nr:hypothetical protein [Tanacetum cinerariifolium]